MKAIKAISSYFARTEYRILRDLDVSEMSLKGAEVSEGEDVGGSSKSAGPAPREDIHATPVLTTSISHITTRSEVEYKVYKRRFFGLFQLVLLNIVVSWDWITFAPVSKTAAQYFETTESVINWLSTAFLFAFVVATPVTSWALNKHGPKLSIIIAAVLILIGNWIKYGGTRSNSIGATMFGQLLIGFAQPFVLSAPTSYSNLWFSSGRTTATALASLSNPFGAALGQLISPFWADKPSDIPSMILYIAVISSVATVPAFFIPAKPPTPPSAGSHDLQQTTTTILSEFRILASSLEFYLIFLPFSVYVGFFNAFSSLINQILEPYGFSEDDAGIAGAILIVCGLVTAAVSSPLVDKYRFYLMFLKLAIPVIAIMYLILVWVPQTRSLAFTYVVCGLQGAASFGLVPVVLEFLVEIHHPIGPELSSSLCWCGGQLLGGIFIVIMDALKRGKDAHPPRNMKQALIFQAVLAMAAMPLPLMLGLFGRKGKVRRKRWEMDQARGEQDDLEEDEQNLNER